MKIIKFTLGFIALLAVAVISLFAICAFAQEKTLPSIAGMEVRSDYINASTLDGVSAVMPSPLPTGPEYILYFDLGYWLPKNTPIDVNVYGDIPAGSNLRVGSILADDNHNEGEGFAHRSIIRTAIPRGDNQTMKAVVVSQWPFRYGIYAYSGYAEHRHRSCFQTGRSFPESQNRKTDWIA